MAANVTIPPKAAKPEALRVAAYCRVSSDSSDQLHSYATESRRTRSRSAPMRIGSAVDVYADEGLTGTRMTSGRSPAPAGDCRKGKVDRVCANPSPASLGTPRTCLAALRELSALGVTVYFEKENIDTGTLTSELMVSVSALWPSRSPSPSPKTSA